MQTATAEKHSVPALAIVARPAADSPIFKTTGPDSLVLVAGSRIAIDDFVVAPAGDIEIKATMRLKAGTDYAVIVAGHELFIVPNDGQAKDVLGGFHYALGGNATARAGGDDVPAINPCSIWDIGFRPSCPDPRGMAYVAGAPGSAGVEPFWSDIYLCAADHLEHGTSVFGATIADGNDPPQQPDGGRYGKFDYATAQAVMAHHGKGLMSVAEFAAAAYGVTERTCAPRDPKKTGLDAAHTSRAGLMQATGNLYAWGHDGDPDTPRAAFFGGYWDDGDWAGSRYASVSYWPDYSHEWFGARGRSDHLTT